MNSCIYFLWGYLRVRVCCTNLHTIQELKVEIEVVTEEITGDALCDTSIVWFIYMESMRSRDIILNLHSQEDHMRTNTP